MNNGDQLQPAVEIFKAARLFNPTKIAEIQPTAAILSDQLRKVPFLNNDACIDGLQRELPTYIAAATDVNPDINVLTWWEIHEQEIPNLAKACKKILLIQPSSAASERVFSLLENSFRDNQALLWRTILKPPSCFSITKDDHIKRIRTLYVVYIILHIIISSDRILF